MDTSNTSPSLICTGISVGVRLFLTRLVRGAVFLGAPGGSYGNLSAIFCVLPALALFVATAPEQIHFVMITCELRATDSPRDPAFINGLLKLKRARVVDREALWLKPPAWLEVDGKPLCWPPAQPAIYKRTSICNTATYTQPNEISRSFHNNHTTSTLMRQG